MRDAGDDGMDMPLKAQRHEGKIRVALERVLGRELEGWERSIPEETAAEINSENARCTCLIVFGWTAVLILAYIISLTFAMGA